MWTLLFLEINISLGSWLLGDGFNYNYYRTLHVALLAGDWETAEKFFKDDPTALTSNITTTAMTPLHTAAVGGQWQIVEKLVKLLPPEALATQDMDTFTALHYVAMGGNLKAAKALVTKNQSLTLLRTSEEDTPLHFAIVCRSSKEFVRYLTFATTNAAPACPFSGPSAAKLVGLLTAAGFHDITLDLIKLYPDLAIITEESGSSILNVLSKMASDFLSGSKLGFWERLIYHFVPVELDHPPPSNLKGDLEDLHGASSNYHYYFGSLIWKAIEKLFSRTKIVRDTKLRHKSAVRLVEQVCSTALTVKGNDDSLLWQSSVNLDMLLNAASSGMVEFLKIFLQSFPELTWATIPNEGILVQIAIRYRQENVFKLFCDIPLFKAFILHLDESGNSISHLAAKLPPPTQLASVPGSAFQMQRELQWFKEVEKLDHPLYKQIKNNEGKTPWQLFREEHQDLLKQGEKWMKGTSNCCMLVATLIATVAFAAIFTVPGGNNQENGFPIFLNDNTFMVFAVADALALFSSITSLFIFFSILAARYAEEDFLESLPKRLILGLIFLFFAIATTTIAFGAAFSLVLRERLRWVAIPITLLAFFSIALFIILQLPLFVKMVKSTYGSEIYHRKKIM